MKKECNHNKKRIPIKLNGKTGSRKKEIVQIKLYKLNGGRDERGPQQRSTKREVLQCVLEAGFP